MFLYHSCSPQSMSHPVASNLSKVQIRSSHSCLKSIFIGIKCKHWIKVSMTFHEDLPCQSLHFSPLCWLCSSHTGFLSISGASQMVLSSEFYGWLFAQKVLPPRSLNEQFLLITQTQVECNLLETSSLTNITGVSIPCSQVNTLLRCPILFL